VLPGGITAVVTTFYNAFSG